MSLINRIKTFAQILTLCLLWFVAASYASQFKVTRVTDGDTLKAESQGAVITIRLVGIDAPETSGKKNQPGQPFSKKSTKYLVSLVLNKTVDIKSYGKDRYGRTLGVVFVNGINVNLEMVKQGLAEVYRGRPPKGFENGPYLKAEAEARDAMLNMWSLGDKYVSPKEWRKMHKGFAFHVCVLYLYGVRQPSNCNYWQEKYKFGKPDIFKVSDGYHKNLDDGPAGAFRNRRFLYKCPRWSYLENLEAAAIRSFGDRSHSAVWIRLATCYIALLGVYFTQEYQQRYPDGSEEGGWSLSEGKNDLLISPGLNDLNLTHAKVYGFMTQFAKV